MHVSRVITRLAAVVTILAICATGAHAAECAVLTNGDLEQLGADGFPLHWARVGEIATTIPDAHSGKVAFRLIRPDVPETAETGVNRAWEPDSGQQGAMLDKLRGGVAFYYKGVSQRWCDWLTVQVIPMSARPYEDTTAARAVFSVPQHHVGDGRWHRGAIKYDFTYDPKVKWVQIAPRVIGPGELVLDDFS